jgi:tRNA pseudouridine38-40 synthase
MRKIKLIIEYDGTRYHGWQIQRNDVTIQGVLEDSIRNITGEQTKVMGASRTDRGVHALGQVAAFRTASKHDPETIKRALNALLPPDIRLLHVSAVNDMFQPRGDARRKRYFYMVVNQNISSAFLYRYAWLIRQPLELSSMKTAGAVLLGTHDFSSFMGTGSGIKNPVREIISLEIKKLKKIRFMTGEIRGNFIKITLEANGFLRHMVRNIVGTLVEVGRGNIPAGRMEEILMSRDRKCAGPTAPGNGLFLEKITYE